MRALGCALLAFGLTSCTQHDLRFDGPDEFPETDDEFGDEDVDVVRDAGRRDAGRDAGRRDAGRLDGGGFLFPLVDSGLFPGFPFADAGLPAPPPPQRLARVFKSDRQLPALSGGTLAVRGAGDFAVAADPDRDRIYVIDLNSNKPATVIQLETGSEPGRVTLDTRGRAHVALRSAGQVVTIELATGGVLARTATCSLPRGIGYDAVQDTLVIACAGGELVTLAAATHQLITNVQLSLDLRDVVIEADGTRVVSRYRSAELLHLDVNGKLISKDAPRTQTQTLPNNFEFLPTGEIVDKGSNLVTASPTLAWRTVASKSSVLMLHQQSRDSEIDLGNGSTGPSYGGGCQTITGAAVTEFGADGRAGLTLPLAPHGLVVDVASSPDGRLIALAEPGSYLRGFPTLEVVDRFSFSSGVDFAADGGGIPIPGFCASGWQGVADGQVTGVAFDDSGKLYAFSREPASLQVFPAGSPELGFNGLPEREIPLALDSVRDTGHELFHADVGSGLSCAGCHGEALDDGHVWNFKNFGARRTQTMRGGLLSTLPLHWEGDLPSFQSLIDEVMTRRMGGFVVEPKYGEALAQWIDKLPPLKLGRAEDSASQRGKALFESAAVGCASCHSGTHLTNNETADVGTGGKFQVPTLLGIALHGPFMHDGCATTLEGRFDPACGGGDAHGKTSQLTGTELADLVSYLKTL